MCQVLYSSFDCRYYDGFDCMGSPDMMRFCYNRRAAAALMITGLILSFAALVYYSLIAFKPQVNKVGGIVVTVLTVLASKLVFLLNFINNLVIFYIIAMGLYVNLRGLVQWNAQLAAFGPNVFSWMNALVVFYGPSFYLAIVSWILALIAVIFVGAHFSTQSKAQQNKTVKTSITTTEYKEIH